MCTTCVALYERLVLVSARGWQAIAISWQFGGANQETGAASCLSDRITTSMAFLKLSTTLIWFYIEK